MEKRHYGYENLYFYFLDLNAVSCSVHLCVELKASEQAYCRICSQVHSATFISLCSMILSEREKKISGQLKLGCHRDLNGNFKVI